LPDDLFDDDDRARATRHINKRSERGQKRRKLNASIRQAFSTAKASTETSLLPPRCYTITTRAEHNGVLWHLREHFAYSSNYLYVRRNPKVIIPPPGADETPGPRQTAVG